MLRIDTHRHFGGSISPEFVWGAIQRTGAYYLAESLAEVQAAMTFAPGEPVGFHRFLDKFRILDEIQWTEQLLDESIKHVCADLLADNIDYCWMRFSINKYLHYLKWHRHEAVRFIYDSYQRHAPGRVGLILSLKYESLRANQRQLAKIIEHPDVQERVVGIDLVGDEAMLDSDFYSELLAPWRRANKVVMAHVGESQSVENVEKAVKHMGVTDVNHGIALFNNGHYDLRAYCRDRGVAFHMALTSNRLTGVWSHQTWHPVRAALRAGCVVTIGTDDPVQCSTTLDAEYALAASYGVSLTDLTALRMNAIRRVRPYLDRAALV